MLQMNVSRRAVSLTPVIAVLAIAGALSCGDDPSAPAEPAENNVTVESKSRVHGTFGPSGGTLSTTSAAGITFTLAIPEGAFPDDMEIAMTPLSTIKGLPYSGSLAGGVQLAPSGLVPVVPLMLTIETTATPDAGQKLVGFTYEGNAKSFEITGAVQGTGGIKVLVPHFSGAGAALAAGEELNPCSNPNDDIALKMLCINPNAPDAADQFAALMHNHLDDVVIPTINASSGDDLRRAIIGQFLRWKELAYGFAGEYHVDPYAEFSEDFEAARTLIADKVVEAVAVAKERCVFTGSIEPLRQITEFAYQAALLGLHELRPELTSANINAGICATVVVDLVQLADPLPLNQDRSLDATFALEINGVRQNGALFGATVTGVGATVQHPTGYANADGLYTTVVRRTSEESATFTVEGCLVLNCFAWDSTSRSFLTHTTFCAGTEVFRDGTAPAGTVSLQSRESAVHADAFPSDEENCVGTWVDDDQSVATGSATISATASTSCTFPGFGASSSTTTLQQVSDPGIAPGGASATMTFECDGTAHAQSANDQVWADCTAYTNTAITFTVEGGQMGYEINASFAGNTGTMMVRLSGPGADVNWFKGANDGESSTFHTSGVLGAGSYYLYYGVNSEKVKAQGATVDATFGGSATVTLTPGSATGRVASRR